MQVRWEYLTPGDFKALVKTEKLCVLPIGSLERHGEHLPFGTDGLIAHEVAIGAAEQEPCVVFPAYWFGQVHEAACFSGTVNFKSAFLIEMLENLLDQIAQNGFEKILILSGHGGNNAFLEYFAISQVDRKVDYTLYIGRVSQGTRYRSLQIWEGEDGHAGQGETSLIMKIAPETVRMDRQIYPEPILPLHDPAVPGVHTGYWWYALYPEQVSASPSKASKEKGETAFRAAVEDVAEMIRRVKSDTLIPALRQEFYARVDKVKKAE